MASESDYDGWLVSAQDVPGILWAAQFGIIVSFVPGKIVAYKDEAPSELLWLHRE